MLLAAFQHTIPDRSRTTGQCHPGNMHTHQSLGVSLTVPVLLDSAVLLGSGLLRGSGEGGVVGPAVTSVGWETGVSVAGTVAGTGVFLGPGVEDAGIGVNSIVPNGVSVVGVPVPSSGQGCSVTGNCRQLSSPTQTFK